VTTDRLGNYSGELKQGVDSGLTKRTRRILPTRLHDARAGCQAIGANQDLALGVVYGADGAAQSSSGEKQTAIAAPDVTEVAGSAGEIVARTSGRAIENTQKLCPDFPVGFTD
jgi:hypothetical protein